ncbi:MAG TPA: protease modulator HflK [Kofleriaceae bacterium]|jgi:membrane protease subunit HflK
MRRRAAPSELVRFAAPAARVLDAAWRRVHWWILAMAVLYALSGITIVHSGEVAIVMRWGHAIPTPLEPGPAFLLPYPIDQVIRVPIKHVFEEQLVTLLDQSRGHSRPLTLDPVSQGYALTGDQNIVHVEMVVRYQIRDPLAWAFNGPIASDIIRTEVTAAMVRSLGELGVDRVLSDGRKDLIATATRRAQSGLDAARAGIEISALELTRLTPPEALAKDFTAVQSASIEATTHVKQAQAFVARAIPEAHTSADRAVQIARSSAAEDAATAEGDADAFLDLERSYRENPAIVRERLYRDSVEAALGASGDVRWVPPPVGGRYTDFHVSIGAAGAGAEQDDERGSAAGEP